MARDETALNNIVRGGYVLRESENAQAVIIATGSEVELVPERTNFVGRTRH
uniref:Uncharacterized protein n=1 Tax=Conchiformibius kuhniae TaxID=211502 RepID=A0A8T9MSF3_9NEIS|nr:hypothetical protein LVJ77_00040 [Conchiformibius kuhniae]